MRAETLLQARYAALEQVIAALSPQQAAQLDALAETLLRALTTSPDEGGYICRLCDEDDCPGECCPVHVRALELMPS